MKALISPNNKQNDKIPHKNTLETKTIRSKSWPHALLSKRHAPAIALVVAGFFIGLVPPAQAIINGGKDNEHNQSSSDQNPTDDLGNMQAQQNETDSSTESTNTEINQNSEVKSESKKNTSVTSDSNISIKTEINSNSSDSSNTTVTVNGEEMAPDSRGRIRQDYKDENSDIRIRGKVDSDKGGSDSSTNIDISTNSSDKP